MPRYYFHLRDGSDFLLDEDGRDLADIGVVAIVALKEARSLISHEVLDGRLNLAQRIEVEAPKGTVVHRLDFSDAVEIFDDGAPHGASEV